MLGIPYSTCERTVWGVDVAPQGFNLSFRYRNHPHQGHVRAMGREGAHIIGAAKLQTTTASCKMSASALLGSTTSLPALAVHIAPAAETTLDRKCSPLLPNAATQDEKRCPPDENVDKHGLQGTWPSTKLPVLEEGTMVPRRHHPHY